MDLVPQPKSQFFRVQCPECENEMIVFNHAKTIVECQNEECEHIIVEPQGGKVIIDAEIIEELE